MKCEDCVYSEIVDWVQDEKTGRATPIYWCEKYDDIQECKMKAKSEEEE